MREWITQLFVRIFSKETNLFHMEPDSSYFPSVEEARVAYPNKEHLQYYKFAGCILGKAVFDKIPVQPQFHLSILLSLLANEGEYPAEKLTYEHMETMD